MSVKRLRETPLGVFPTYADIPRVIVSCTSLHPAFALSFQVPD